MSSLSKTKMDEHSLERKEIQPLTTTLPHKVFSISALAVSLIPYVWVLGIISLAIRARLYLGHWPKPSHPDPKHLPFEFHQAVLWAIFEGVKWSIVIVPTLYLASRILLKTKLGRSPLHIYLLGWGVIALMIIVPHIDFVMWFMD